MAGDMPFRCAIFRFNSGDRKSKQAEPEEGTTQIEGIRRCLVITCFTSFKSWNEVLSLMTHLTLRL